MPLPFPELLGSPAVVGLKPLRPVTLRARVSFGFALFQKTTFPMKETLALDEAPERRSATEVFACRGLERKAGASERRL